MKRYAALANVSAILLVLIGKSESESQEARVVNTIQGPVRGYLDPDGDIFSFYNIPYATAPTGTHRFRVITLFLYYKAFEVCNKKMLLGK